MEMVNRYVHQPTFETIWLDQCFYFFTPSDKHFFEGDLILFVELNSPSAGYSGRKILVVVTLYEVVSPSVSEGYSVVSFRVLQRFCDGKLAYL